MTEQTLVLVFQIPAQKGLFWLGVLGSKYLLSCGVWKPREKPCNLQALKFRLKKTHHSKPLLVMV